MSKLTEIRKYKHLNNIIDGKYSTARYEKNDVDEERNLDKVSNDLLVTDAKRHLAQLIKVRKDIDFEPKEVTKPKMVK